MNKRMATSDASSPTRQRSNAIYLQLDQCLKANSCGGSNPEALREVQTFCENLKSISSIFNEKANDLRGGAEILYSPRKHADWDNPAESGADRVYHFMLCDLVRIKSIIDRISDDDW